MRKVRIALLAAVLAAFCASAVAARADNASTLTVVGTSDVFDSNLVQTVLKPGFEAAFPQYTLNYVSKGTGAAIDFAKAGTASALLVHAASLENQFVAQGYSNEKYGRAIFWGDYVLLGPASDPAGVMAAAPHDIVGAFERIAQAGADGKATFVSRGGTPGTTVQEHAIWALANGVSQCNVSDVNGGGMSPSSTTGACPASPDPIPYPSWYKATGLTQGPNIVAGDACNFPSGANSCYVFTDRGTFQYLQSTGAIHGLHIVTRDNSPTARGTTTALVNSFHAYALNPAKFTGRPNVQLNVTAATAFLDWVTSPAGQTAVGAFLSSGADPPFIPSAAPAVTASSLASSVPAGSPIVVNGNVRNVVPGTPSLAGQVVTLSALQSSVAALNPVAVAAPVATATTDAAGNYSISYIPAASAAYSVSTGQLTQVENSALNPIFGDLLNPTTRALGNSDVLSAVDITSVSAAYRQAVVSGTIAPGTGHGNAKVTIAYRKGTTGTFTALGTSPIGAGQPTFAIPVKLAPGAYQLEAIYEDRNVVIGSTSAPVAAGVPGQSAATIASAKVSKGRLTLKGSLNPGAKSSGARIVLLGRHTTRVKLAHNAKRSARAVASSALHVVARLKIPAGHSTFTLHAKLKRGYHWQLQLRYLHTGVVDQASSRLRGVDVH